MAKYALKNDGKNLAYCIGIGEERLVLIGKTIEHGFIDTETPVELLEYCLNELDPQNIIEATFIGYAIAKKYEYENPLNKLYSELIK